MEGLLRKYKISKISDNVKLSKQELKVCRFLDKTLIGLSVDGESFNNDDGVCIFEYTNSNILYVSKTHCWEVLEDFGLQYFDIKIVVKNWVEDIYNLKGIKFTHTFFIIWIGDITS